MCVSVVPGLRGVAGMLTWLLKHNYCELIMIKDLVSPLKFGRSSALLPGIIVKLSYYIDVRSGTT